MASTRPPAFSAPSRGAVKLELTDSLFDNDDDDNSKTKNFKVVVRVRPFIDREHGKPDCLTIKDDQMVLIDRPAEFGLDKTHRFIFDRIYTPSSSQQSLYDSAIKPVVLSVLEGYNGSIIAYGQTGTGKTYTVEGGKHDARGIIPRAGEDIFGFIENESDAQSKYLVRTSFLQIYNEKVADLLNPEGFKKQATEKRPSLKIRETGGGGVYVQGLSEHIVRSPSDIVDLLKLGTTMRSTAATKMNRESSRSHAVFTVIVERSETDKESGETSVTIGKLNLVDLAGSERIKSTGIVGGAHLDEMKNINTSLSAFGKVILALTSPGNHHVPYRDSKLTRILQGSLGGNCKTTMITAVTSCADSYPETLNSFKFAKRAKNVKNFAVVNQDLSDQALLSAYEKEIKKLRRALDAKKPVVDAKELELLKQQQQLLASEKEQIQGKLKEQAEQVAQAEAQKEMLAEKIQGLEHQLLQGGAKIEESPEFHAAVQEAEERLQREFDDKFRALEEERRRLDEERAKLMRERTELHRQRTELLRQRTDTSTASSATTATTAAAAGGGVGGATEDSDASKYAATEVHPLSSRDEAAYDSLMRTTASMVVGGRRGTGDSVMLDEDNQHDHGPADMTSLPSTVTTTAVASAATTPRGSTGGAVLAHDTRRAHLTLQVEDVEDVDEAEWQQQQQQQRKQQGGEEQADASVDNERMTSPVGKHKGRHGRRHRNKHMHKHKHKHKHRHRHWRGHADENEDEDHDDDGGGAGDNDDNDEESAEVASATASVVPAPTGKKHVGRSSPSRLIPTRLLRPSALLPTRWKARSLKRDTPAVSTATSNGDAASTDDQMATTHDEQDDDTDNSYEESDADAGRGHCNRGGASGPQHTQQHEHGNHSRGSSHLRVVHTAAGSFEAGDNTDAGGLVGTPSPTTPTPSHTPRGEESDVFAEGGDMTDDSSRQGSATSGNSSSRQGSGHQQQHHHRSVQQLLHKRFERPVPPVLRARSGGHLDELNGRAGHGEALVPAGKRRAHSMAPAHTAATATTGGGGGGGNVNPAPPVSPRHHRPAGRFPRSASGHQDQLSSAAGATANDQNGATKRRSPLSTESSALSSSDVIVTDADVVVQEEDEEAQNVQTLRSYMRALRDPNTGIPTQTLTHNHTLCRHVFSGEAAAGWFMANMEGIDTLSKAEDIGTKFLQLGLVRSLQYEDVAAFRIGPQDLYQFTEFDSSQPMRPSSSRARSSLQQRASASASASDELSPRQPAKAAPTEQQRPTPPSASKGMTRRRSWLGGRPRMLSASRLRRNTSEQSLGTPVADDESHPEEGASETVMSASMVRSAGFLVDDAETDDNGASLLHRAAGQGDKTAVRQFLQTIPVDSLDMLDRSPLMYAAIANKIKAVEILLRAGADATLTDANGRSSLLWAAYYGHHEVLKLLLKAKPSAVALPDPDGRTALHWSCKHGSTKSLDVLLKFASAELVNHQDEEHVTALHWAVLCQHSDHTLHLIRAGASARIPDSEGRTPIHYAVSNDSPRCLRALLEAPEDAVNVRDHRGRTALHLAISAQSSLDAIGLLLACSNIDVNCTDVRMTTPLHWAAVCNRPDVCQVLVRRGAKLQFRDISGMTPLHYAINKNFHECANVLQALAAEGDQIHSQRRRRMPSARRRSKTKAW